MNPDGVMRPRASAALVSTNQRFPSGPATIGPGLAPDGMMNSVMTPAGVMRPIRWPFRSLNQTFPSGPAVMQYGPAFAVGILNSVNIPAVVTLAIWPAIGSVNHTM